MTLILTSKKKTVMKKILFMMSLSALAFVSCQKSEIEEAASPAGQNTYTFVVNNVSETKATIGDKNGTQWPVLWAAGDQIGVYGGGQLLGVATLDEGSAGCNCGNFTLTTNAPISAGDELYLSYPYTEGAEMKKGQVAEKHTLTEAGIGANGVAYAYAEYTGENTEFTLTHLNAYLKFNLSSSEFAGYSLEGITFWAKGAKLSGGVEVGNGDVVTYTGVGDYVKTTLAAPTEMSTTAQPVYVSTLPDDLTGKEVYAIVHMTKGIETVTLPVKLNGAGNIPAGSVTEVTLPALKKSLAPKWYEPVETRYIAAYGDGWCYGPENTIIFKALNTEVDVEFKARGNFMKVKEPTHVQVQYVTDMSNQKGTGWVKIGGEEAYDGSAYKSHPLDGDYKASIQITKLYNTGPNAQITALLVKSGDEVVWGTNLLTLTKDIETVSYANGDIMKWNLGTGRDIKDYNDWKSNGCYFQWGRPWAFPYSNKAEYGISYVTNNESNKVDLELSASTPWTMYNYDGEPYDWYWGDGSKDDRSDDLDDLWGNPDNASSGVKTIYDPCPEGYRVISPAILNEVSKNISATVDAETGAITSTGAAEIVIGAKVIYVDYNGSYWPFAGAFQNNGGSYNRISNTVDAAVYWTNANSGNNVACMWWRRTKKDNKYAVEVHSKRARSTAASIRCMVDTEDR